MTQQTTPGVGQGIESKVVHLQLTADDPPKCVVVPEELEMMESGIAWVTWVNLTGQDAEIHFLEGGAIGNTDSHTVPASGALTLRLINPTPAEKKQHEYSVKVEGYEQPIAGPKIIVP